VWGKGGGRKKGMFEAGGQRVGVPVAERPVRVRIGQDMRKAREKRSLTLEGRQALKKKKVYMDSYTQSRRNPQKKGEVAQESLNYGWMKSTSKAGQEETGPMKTKSMIRFWLRRWRVGGSQE